MEDYYEYLDSNGVTTLYKLIKDDTVALIDSYSVTINGITTNLDNHVNNIDIHTPIADIEGMIDTAIGSLNFATPDYVDTKVADLVNSSPETLDTLKELSDALGNDSNFATTVANQIGSKANKDDVYTKQETDTLLEGKANSEHSHVVSDITDFPTIPTKVSDLTNDSGYITSVSWEDVTDKPELSQVAISGSYSDLSGTPTIPTKTSQLINDSGFLTSSNGLITSVSWNDITNKPNFSTVATSGSYTDLSNTPTIPTKVSQLENDMGFGTGGDTSDCVHKTGDETIGGYKVFRDPIFRKSDITTSTVDMVYRFEDANNSPCGYIQNNVHYWQNNLHNRHLVHNNTSGKEMYLEVVSSNDGSGVVNIGGTVTNNLNLTPGTFLSPGSTFVATMGWVMTYVNSRAGFRAVGPSAVGSSISAYYSNATTLTSEGSFSSSGGSYPSDYSDYIDISPTVGTIYTGSQLFGTLNASASGSKDSYTESGSTVYQTTAKATANFSGAFSPSAKYLCTTANAVKFRAFVSEGTSSAMGTTSVVDNSSTKSIFTRIE